MKTLEFTLAGALRHMLDDSGLQQLDLADKADISKGSVTNYAKGRQVPRWTTVQRWAVACGFDPDDETLRELWERAREFGCIYETLPLFDLGDLAFRDDRGRFHTPVAPTRPPVVGDEGNRAA